MRNVAYVLPSLNNKATASSYVILSGLVLRSLTHIMPCLLASGSGVRVVKPGSVGEGMKEKWAEFGEAEKSDE